MIKISTLKKSHLYSAATIIAILPVIAWLQLTPLTERFENPYATLTSISQVSALLGTVLFALVLLLRLSPQTKQSAKIIGTASLLFLLTHPIVATVKLTAFASIASVSLFDWSVSLGMYALLLLLSLGLITFFANRQNQKLQSIPFALNGILFLGTFHAFVIPSSLSESLFIKTYILSLTSVVAITYTANYLSQKYRQRIPNQKEVA